MAKGGIEPIDLEQKTAVFITSRGGCILGQN